MRCFLDVADFQGGSLNLPANISDLLIHVQLSKFSSGQASILVFPWLQWLQCVDRCLTRVTFRLWIATTPNAELITISCFLDADSCTGFVKVPRRSCYNPTRFCARFFLATFCISAPATYTVPSIIGRQKHALRQTQTSRTKACSNLQSSQKKANIHPPLVHTTGRSVK